MNITMADIWTWQVAGCNENEIAEYTGVSIPVAIAWMRAARCQFASGLIA